MTIGGAVATISLALAFALAFARTRDAFWAVMSVVFLGFTAYALVRGGLDTSRFVSTTDGLLMVAGLLLATVTVILTMGLSKAAQDRLVYGRAYPERAFDLALIDARRPFVEAAQTRDASMDEKASWRAALNAPPPNESWAVLADRLAIGDELWVAHVRAGSTRDEWLPWQARNDQVFAEWNALRQRVRSEGFKRARWVNGLASVAYAASLALVLAGALDVTNGLSSAPPSGRAAVVPAAPPGRSLHLAPLGDFPMADVRELADFYEERYGLRVDILSPTPIPEGARDTTAKQVVAEAVIDGLVAAYPEAQDGSRVVIGLTTEDLRIRARPDWAWAFGFRFADRLAVLSTARMGPEPGPFGDRLEAARLRKMVTKYVGVLYFDLAPSSNPQSVLYDSILGVPDLDAMGEDF